MSQYEVVLSLHILAVIIGFGVAAVAHTTMFRLRNASTMQQVRTHLPILDKVGPLFPVAAILLFVFGAYLIQISPHDEKFHWSDGWVITAIVTLVVVEAVGGAVIGRGAKVMAGKLEGVPDGPVDASTRAVLADKGVWIGSHFTTAAIASVVFVMVGKPSGAGAVVIVVIGSLVGIASAIPFTKPVTA
ncbi:MAG: putative integral rane protein [Actinomycetota bacterium]|jgi:hypothetical protein|nr:putative integral rane protein [Actinomycetota bacterium]